MFIFLMKDGYTIFYNGTPFFINVYPSYMPGFYLV